MGQVTIYLDTEAEAKVRQAAKAMNTSLSQWISDLIKERTAEVWPDSVKKLAGAWKDLPNLEEIRSGMGEDTPREEI
jgi:hypothetical protein